MEQTARVPLTTEGNASVDPPAEAPGIFALAPFPLFFSRLEATLCNCQDSLRCTGTNRGNLQFEQSTPRASKKTRQNEACSAASPSAASPSVTSSWRRGDFQAGSTTALPSESAASSTDGQASPLQARESRNIPQETGRATEVAESGSLVSLFCCTRWKHFSHRKRTEDGRGQRPDGSLSETVASGENRREPQRSAATGSGVVCGLLAFDGCEFLEGRLLYRHLNPHLSWNAETWERLFYALTNPTWSVGDSGVPTSAGPLSPVSVSRPRTSTPVASPSVHSDVTLSSSPSDRASSVRLLLHPVEPGASDEDVSERLSAERRRSRRPTAGGGDWRNRGEQNELDSATSLSVSSLRHPQSCTPGNALSPVRTPTRLPSASSSVFTTSSPTLFSVSSLAALSREREFTTAPADPASEAVSQADSRRPARGVRTPQKYALSLVMGLSDASEVYVHLTAPIRLHALPAATGTTKLFTASLLLQQLQLQEQKRLFDSSHKCAAALDACTAELAEAAATRERQQRRLLRGMCLLLNSKKKRLRELERELEDQMKMHASSGHPAASAASSGLNKDAKETPLHREASSKEGCDDETDREEGAEVASSKNGRIRGEAGFHLASSQVEPSGLKLSGRADGRQKRWGGPERRPPSLSGETTSRQVLPERSEENPTTDAGPPGAESHGEDSERETVAEEDEVDECLRWVAREVSWRPKKRKLVNMKKHEDREAQGSAEGREENATRVAEETHGQPVPNGDSESGSSQQSTETGPGLEGRRDAPSRSGVRALDVSTSSPISVLSSEASSSPSRAAPPARSLQSEGMLEVRDKDKFAAAFALIDVKKEPASESEDGQLAEAGEEEDPPGVRASRAPTRQLRSRRSERRRVEESEGEASGGEKEDQPREAGLPPQSGARKRLRLRRRHSANAWREARLPSFASPGGLDGLGRNSRESENATAGPPEESDSLEETQCLGETLEGNLTDGNSHDSETKKGGRRPRRRRG
ncbi:hypothetical protein TGMAS_312830 [Toxoplasma gondii MAS]|uniref:Uncharacterized protein n=1 Tax=Toxoplasma gondii MAS TaxID=943118 RepID=A0A086QZ17_TOXGO|nr:hypothetical protein TGMAS_312830 [Toxoplasma gondii MAS]